MSLANTTQLERLEYRFEQMRLALQQALQAIAKLQSDLANLQQGGGGNSGGQNSIYWATNSSAVGPATGSTLAGLTPATFTSNIYVDNGGTMTLVATSATVRWFYLDTAAANSIIPVEPAADQMAWDAIGNGCTAL